MAAAVVASSHALEMDSPRSYPRLLSSGGNGVGTTREGEARSGERLLAGIGCCAPCGGFHCNEIEAVFSLDLKNFNWKGYARPPSSRIVALCSLSWPEATHASINGSLSSFNHNRAPF